MRLFLLPISTRRTLIYCQRLNQQLSSELTYVDKITTKAATIWVSWEKGDKKWQHTVTRYGNKALRRIPFEEWGLKSIPPLSARKEAEKLKGKEKVEVIFPGSYVKEDRIGEVLMRIGTERQGLHKKWMWWSVVGMPIKYLIFPSSTSSFELGRIGAVSPRQFPYTHMLLMELAFSGSKHLEFILDKSLYNSYPSPALDVLYTAGLINKARHNHNAESDPIKDDKRVETTQDSSEPQEMPEKMLLQQWNGKLIAQALEVPELEVELERAIWQVEESLKANEELEKEKKSIEAATVDPEREIKR
ncbi:MAG: hypothetical protein M1812_007088 [Candelaria pacifica]|nr:MAG: hypothetical protein M1812_007088 [Candelaria pacifica]